MFCGPSRSYKPCETLPRELEGSEFKYPAVGTVNWLGRLMLRLPKREAGHLSVIFQDIYPNKMGQANSKLKEVGRRFLFGMEILLTLPLTIPLSALGVPVVKISDVAKKRFWILSPKQMEVPSKNPESIDILSQNIGALPVLSPVNDLERPSWRRKRIVDSIVKKDAEIVCLQEAFDSQVQKQLICDLWKAGYRYFISDVEPKKFSPSSEEAFGIVGFGSGLFAASKYPIISNMVDFRKFDDVIGVDRFANKGVLGFVVQVGELPGRRRACLLILTTHMQAGETDNGGIEKRQEQLELIKEFSEELKEKLYENEDVYMGTVACGDFNLGPLRGVDQKTGLLREDTEWEMENSFRERFVNVFYESDRFDSKLRSSNLALIFQLQKELYSFFSEGEKDDFYVDFTWLEKALEKRNPYEEGIYDLVRKGALHYWRKIGKKEHLFEETFPKNALLKKIRSYHRKYTVPRQCKGKVNKRYLEKVMTWELLDRGEKEEEGFPTRKSGKHLRVYPKNDRKMLEGTTLDKGWLHSEEEPQASYSILDHFWIKEDSRRILKSSMTINPDLREASDHFAVVAKMKLSFQKKKR